MSPLRVDVLVAGAGPAGMAAASRAAEGGRRVLILDSNPRPGGQIWRPDVSAPPPPAMLPWSFRIHERHIEVWNNAHIAAFADPKQARVELADGFREVSYSKLILATGARERFLPFPGWTLPGVMGAGALQALAKSGWPVNSRRVVVAGTGPLLLAVASYLRGRGAKVLMVAEQAGSGAISGFITRLLREPKRFGQALRARASLFTTPYRPSHWPVAAEGDGKLERVIIRSGAGTRTVACDFLACGFGLIPNIETAQALGCSIRDGKVTVDEFQQTSLPNIYAAGEITGIGGLEMALAEGEIAGFAAADKLDAARQRFPARASHAPFAALLEKTFVLRPELRELPKADTIVCRCEDVNLAGISACSGWREAKLYTRCGMGPCQGRVCGDALNFLRGWTHDSNRPPIFPSRAGSLAEITSENT